MTQPTSQYFSSGEGLLPINAYTAPQLDQNSLIWSQHHGPETANQNWIALNGKNYVFEHPTYGTMTWVNQSANANTWGITAQAFICPPGVTSVKAGFDYIQDGFHSPLQFTWGIHDGTNGFVTSGSATPTPNGTLQSTAVTATGMTPGSRYYFVIQANVSGGPGQSAFLMRNAYVTPVGGNNALLAMPASGAATFVRHRVDARTMRRSTFPDAWHASGYVQTPSALAYYEVTTDATTIVLDAYCDLQGVFQPSGFRIDVNGSFNQYVTPSVAGPSLLTVTLPAGMKRVRITIGSQAWNAGFTAVIGSWLRAVYYPVTANVMFSPFALQHPRRVLIFGDSRSMQCAGNFTEGQSVGDHNAYALLADKGAFEPMWAGYGSLALSDVCASAAAAQALVSRFMEAQPTDIYLAIGLNDYLRPTTSAAGFGTNAGLLVTALNAQAVSAGVRCWWESPPPCVTETANSFGSTLPNYRTQISTAVSGTKIVFVDGTGMGLVAASDCIADGIHFNDQGEAKHAAGIALAMSLSG